MIPYQKLINLLIKRGYKILGAGCYSIVFKSKLSDSVIKIGSTLADPWLIYAETVQSINNPHFPKVYNIHQFEHLDYYVARVERLKPIGMNFTDTQYRSFIDEMLNNRPSSEASRQAVRILNQLLSRMDYAKLDLHLENIMLRGETLVLSDPLAEREIDSSFEAWIEETLSEKYSF